MLAGLDWTIFAGALLAGVLLDALLGEVSRFHPLVGFGRLASAIEKRLNPRAAKPAAPFARFIRGALAWALAVLPLTMLAAWLCAQSLPPAAQTALHAILLYFCLGLCSLRDHMLPIWLALQAGDLAAARALTARIVSRDTGHATESDLAKAATESMLENGNDAVFGTLFWFAIAGGPGALMFRLANTLDAMWGYRTERFNLFGRSAARIDDALNYLPARLTAISYALLAPGAGGTRRALACWRRQAPAWSSPNAGPVMSTGAGALGLQLGGAASYGGEIEQRPPLGQGDEASAADIPRAWHLVRNTTGLWLAILLAISYGVHHA
ncbi:MULTISPECIES: adenosylcobinamide-phosphate synthase CbiB [unclassified Duganella]|uniref:adenosylcobinamide-phosphate synthase CbiB n=1 Tax=unclassified Duganella TaxID=2636909 RepID=UPI0006F7D07B|nr:cobalamin biosynthesis protein CobD [Duganella sp. Root336D2]KRB91540.1 cobalamin biosynthesis protein CobD [Duganella sp. Root198D2]